jgi:hypothetical protein
MFRKLLEVAAMGAITVAVLTGCMVANVSANISENTDDSALSERESDALGAATKFGTFFRDGAAAASDFSSAALNNAIANGAVTQPLGATAVSSSERASTAACDIIAAGTATQEQAFTIYDTGRFAGDIGAGVTALSAGDGFAGIAEAGAVAVQYIELGQSVQKLVGATAPALPQALTGLCDTGSLTAS